MLLILVFECRLVCVCVCTAVLRMSSGAAAVTPSDPLSTARQFFAALGAAFGMPPPAGAPLDSGAAFAASAPAAAASDAATPASEGVLRLRSSEVDPVTGLTHLKFRQVMFRDAEAA